MPEGVPAIRVTDPHSKDSAPNLPQSPNRGNEVWDGDFRRPTSPASKRSPTRQDRPTPPTTHQSSGRLVRSNSSNVSQHINGQTQQLSESAPRSGQPLPPIDPLSLHIYERTHVPRNNSPSASVPPFSEISSAVNDRVSEEQGIRRRGTSTSPRRDENGGAGKDKHNKKGVSFLSRIIGSKKKEQGDDVSDNVSVYSDVRPEGAEAQVFSQPVDNIEYSPRYPQPPAYIKIRTKNKKEKEFDRLFLAQELQVPPKPSENGANGKAEDRKKSSTTPDPHTIWATEWSKDGKYLATAGHDKVVRVWAVISSPEERHAEEHIEANAARKAGSDSLRLSCPVFQSKPIREYHGHTATILDLSWSKNNFLLSSSMDKTVRLWHTSRAECLCTFKHNDFVPSISFHPKDDRFFLAGSLDSKLRLWSIPDKTVAYWSQLPDMITAVSFTPDGKYAIAGCLGGLCMFYETEGLKYQTQIHVRSAHGKNAKGSKITGIVTTTHPPNSANGIVKLLISSNDSRIRLYNFRDKSMEVKFKGSQNSSSQIRGSISDDYRYVCCGSEDRRAYIWPLGQVEGDKRDKQPVEMFEAHNTVTTCVTFAPTKTRQLLGHSEDPIYDLCNPPPVTLWSKGERADSQNSGIPHVDATDSAQPALSGAEAKSKKLEETSAQIARSRHSTGHIIVTADYSGRIKVFRHDCAFSKRRVDLWETSPGFLKRMNSTRTGRSTSVKTKGSNRSLRSGRDSAASTQAPSERILSWRQGIASTPSIVNGSSRPGGNGERSVSPRKSSGQMSVRSNQTRGESHLRSSAAVTTESLPSTLPSAAQSSSMSPRDGGSSSESSKQQQQQQQQQQQPAQDQQNSISPRIDPATLDPLMLQGEQSNLFWNMSIYRKEAQRARENADPIDDEQASSGAAKEGLGVPGSGSGALARNQSYVSQLSIDRSSIEEDSDEDSPRKKKK